MKSSTYEKTILVNRAFDRMVEAAKGQQQQQQQQQQSTNSQSRKQQEDLAGTAR